MTLAGPVVDAALATFEEVAVWLGEHWDLVQLLFSQHKAGVPKEVLVTAVRGAGLAASDEEMKKELAP